ncbi:MAG: hypothetical protein AAFR74_00215 [Pseudomonadota bacterium]
MLFLLNDQIAELDAPEAHLLRRWRSMGCGDPFQMRAQDAIEFVRDAVSAKLRSGARLDNLVLQDYAALIVAKTGANSLILKPRADGSLEPRLQDLPRLVLETYKRGAANDLLQQPARA